MFGLNRRPRGSLPDFQTSARGLPDSLMEKTRCLPTRNVAWLMEVNLGGTAVPDSLARIVTLSTALPAMENWTRVLPIGNELACQE